MIVFLYVYVKMVLTDHLSCLAVFCCIIAPPPAEAQQKMYTDTNISLDDKVVARKMLAKSFLLKYSADVKQKKGEGILKSTDIGVFVFHPYSLLVQLANQLC